MPKEETSPIPLKFIDVMRSTCTDLDVAQEKRIDDYWNVDEDRRWSDSWTGFTKFTLLKETPPKGKNVVRGETDRNSNNYSTRSYLARGMDKNWESRSEKKKQEWAIEKPKLENARNLRGIYSIVPNDQEYKDIIKTREKILETSMADAMPCKRSSVTNDCRKSSGCHRKAA